MTTQKPVLIIVMGVSGCGKSTIARALSKAYKYEFIEADRFHSDEARAHMASGKALTDDMRLPWIERMCTYIRQRHVEGISCVLSYSGLRREHRQKFRALDSKQIFIFLQGSKALISKRISKRSHHFMPQSLLDSQFEALQEPNNEADIFTVEIGTTVSKITATAKAIIDKHCRL